MDADRKKRGLPAVVPRPRGVNLLDPEDRSPERQKEDDDYGDYEVTGLMCESEDGDVDCDSLEIETRENILCVFDRDPSVSGNAEQFCGCDSVCGVCEAQEEISTIQLDASRVVLPHADEAGEAETHQVARIIFTMFFYAVGMFYVLGADS